MDEKRARKILGIAVTALNELDCVGNCITWPSNGDKKYVQVVAQFTADELEAIAWWMRNK